MCICAYAHVCMCAYVHTRSLHVLRCAHRPPPVHEHTHTYGSGRCRERARPCMCASCDPPAFAAPRELNGRTGQMDRGQIALAAPMVRESTRQHDARCVMLEHQHCAHDTCTHKGHSTAARASGVGVDGSPAIGNVACCCWCSVAAPCPARNNPRHGLIFTSERNRHQTRDRTRTARLRDLASEFVERTAEQTRDVARPVGRTGRDVCIVLVSSAVRPREPQRTDDRTGAELQVQAL